MESEPGTLHSFFEFFQVLSLFQIPSINVLIGLGLIAILLACSGLISGSEVAFFSLEPSDIHKLTGEKSSTSKLILTLKEKPRLLLATILIANNGINIAIVILSDFVIRNWLTVEQFYSWARNITTWIPFSTEVDRLAIAIEFGITIIVVTFLLVLFGEVVPKMYANINNLRFARIMARPLIVLRTLFIPVSKILINWSRIIEKLLARESVVTNRPWKSDIDKAIELTVSHEGNSEKEIDILKRIVKFSEVTVKQIMRFRVDVVAVNINCPFDEVLRIVKESGFSRIPVFDDDFDQIRGILYVKDLLIHMNKPTDFPWQELVRSEVKFVPESKRINDLLKEFQKERTHMAIVVDEFGGSAGLVTLEDIMEEVVGDIRDEFDEDEDLEYKQLDKWTYIFEGKTLLNDLYRVVGIEANTFDPIRGDADSVAGLILELLGRIPRENSEIRYRDFRFKVLSVSQKRIEKVQITLPKKDESLYGN